MGERDSITDEPRRDEQGRFMAGHSGNPVGRGPGRPSDRLNELADEVAEKVLLWALGVFGDAQASKADRERAIRAVSPMVSRRVTAREEVTQLDAAAEQRIAELEEMLIGGWEAQTVGEAVGTKAGEAAQSRLPAGDGGEATEKSAAVSGRHTGEADEVVKRCGSATRRLTGGPGRHDMGSSEVGRPRPA